MLEVGQQLLAGEAQLELASKPLAFLLKPLSRTARGLTVVGKKASDMFQASVTFSKKLLHSHQLGVTLTETERSITGVSNLRLVTNQGHPTLINKLYHAAQAGGTVAAGVELSNSSPFLQKAITQGYDFCSKLLPGGQSFALLELIAHKKPIVTVPAGLHAVPAGLHASVASTVKTISMPESFFKPLDLGLGVTGVTSFMNKGLGGLCMPLWLFPYNTITQRRRELRTIFSKLARTIEKDRKTLASIPSLPEHEGYALFQRLVDTIPSAIRQSHKDIARFMVRFDLKHTDDLAIQQLLELISIASVRTQLSLGSSKQFVLSYQPTDYAGLIQESKKLLKALGGFVYNISGKRAVPYSGLVTQYPNSSNDIPDSDHFVAGDPTGTNSGDPTDSGPDGGADRPGNNDPSGSGNDDSGGHNPGGGSENKHTKPNTRKKPSLRDMLRKMLSMIRKAKRFFDGKSDFNQANARQELISLQGDIKNFNEQLNEHYPNCEGAEELVSLSQTILEALYLVEANLNQDGTYALTNDLVAALAKYERALDNKVKAQAQDYKAAEAPSGSGDRNSELPTDSSLPLETKNKEMVLQLVLDLSRDLENARGNLKEIRTTTEEELIKIIIKNLRQGTDHNRGTVISRLNYYADQCRNKIKGFAKAPEMQSLMNGISRKIYDLVKAINKIIETLDRDHNLALCGGQLDNLFLKLTQDMLALLIKADADPGSGTTGFLTSTTHLASSIYFDVLRQTFLTLSQSTYAALDRLELIATDLSLNTYQELLHQFCQTRMSLLPSVRCAIDTCQHLVQVLDVGEYTLSPEASMMLLNFFNGVKELLNTLNSAATDLRKLKYPQSMREEPQLVTFRVIRENADRLRTRYEELSRILNLLVNHTSIMHSDQGSTPADKDTIAARESARSKESRIRRIIHDLTQLVLKARALFLPLSTKISKEVCTKIYDKRLIEVALLDFNLSLALEHKVVQSRSSLHVMRKTNISIDKWLIETLEFMRRKLMDIQKLLRTTTTSVKNKDPNHLKNIFGRHSKDLTQIFREIWQRLRTEHLGVLQDQHRVLDQPSADTLHCAADPSDDEEQWERICGGRIYDPADTPGTASSWERAGAYPATGAVGDNTVLGGSVSQNPKRKKIQNEKKPRLQDLLANIAASVEKRTKPPKIQNEKKPRLQDLLANIAASVERTIDKLATYLLAPEAYEVDSWLQEAQRGRDGLKTDISKFNEQIGLYYPAFAGVEYLRDLSNTVFTALEGNDLTPEAASELRARLEDYAVALSIAQALPPKPPVDTLGESS